VTKLVLWDIDRTLLYAGGVDKEVWRETCIRLTGTAPTTLAGTSGRTDPQILLDALLACDVGTDRAERLLPRALELEVALLAQRAGELRERGHAMPGAAGALAALAERSDVVQSVVTGNVRDNARLKLACFDLHKHLDLEIGAYGSDDGHRPSLVRLAQHRARQIRDLPVTDANTVIVGDSTRDVHAARSCHVRSVAVATGRTAVDELTAAGADVVLTDLTDVDAVLKAIM
jgi:phosphoglycolate phosphatase